MAQAQIPITFSEVLNVRSYDTWIKCNCSFHNLYLYLIYTNSIAIISLIILDYSRLSILHYPWTLRMLSSDHAPWSPINTLPYASQLVVCNKLQQLIWPLGTQSQDRRSPQKLPSWILIRRLLPLKVWQMHWYNTQSFLHLSFSTNNHLLCGICNDGSHIELK